MCRHTGSCSYFTFLRWEMWSLLLAEPLYSELNLTELDIQPVWMKGGLTSYSGIIDCLACFIELFNGNQMAHLHLWLAMTQSLCLQSCPCYFCHLCLLPYHVNQLCPDCTFWVLWSVLCLHNWLTFLLAALHLCVWVAQITPLSTVWAPFCHTRVPLRSSRDGRWKK